MRDDVVFATMTLARTAAEEESLVRALGRLAAHGRPVFVADGGSAPQFVETLAALPSCCVCASAFGPGLVGQIRTAVDKALQASARLICYTEPDKLHFFDTAIGSFLARVDAGGSFGVALAARMPAAFETFPPMQKYAERAINDLTSEVLGIAGDYSYGPFVMSREVAHAVARLSDDIGWGWRHFAFVTARRLRQSIALHPGPFDCPLDQRIENVSERLHRVRQLEQNSRGLLLALEAPERPDGRDGPEVREPREGRIY
jgi:hypothetical protein